MKLTKFGQFLVDIFDNEERMTHQEESQMDLELFCHNGSII